METSDEPQQSRIPNLLAYEQRADTRTTRHERAGSHIGTPQIRPNIVRRVDVGAEIRCLKLAVAQMSVGEWQAYIALKEGVLFDVESGRRWWHVVPPPATSATPEQAAMHYGVRPDTILRYDREARRIIERIRTAAGLTGDERRVPIWPAIQDDESLLRHLFPMSKNTRLG